MQLTFKGHKISILRYLAISQCHLLLKLCNKKKTQSKNKQTDNQTGWPASQSSQFLGVLLVQSWLENDSLAANATQLPGWVLNSKFWLVFGDSENVSQKCLTKKISEKIGQIWKTCFDSFLKIGTSYEKSKVTPAILRKRLKNINCYAVAFFFRFGAKKCMSKKVPNSIHKSTQKWP